ncbi:hypothetical protein [Limnovirga soli]|uniref:Uncharacterized protein n=1 Tax=Limnovirga soli TaxID=2656915 RepID=A0A8J8FB43_9BACT|nr:hypothetical protein [Limnovirga soli]NNV54748.1 hypothetical protein [Limnovirga soli]
MKQFTIICLIGISLFSEKCDLQTNQSKLNPEDLFQKEVPYDGMSKGSLFASITFIRDSLKLDTLEKGFDSLQIRIWLGYSFTSRQQLIILKNSKGNWKSYYYEFNPYYFYREKEDSLLYFEKSIIEKKPKVSWNDFMNRLYGNQILTLPQYKKIKNYEIPNDPNYISIEISTETYYRLYQYASPIFGSKVPEAKYVENIINIITNEFDIRLYAPI